MSNFWSPPPFFILPVLQLEHIVHGAGEAPASNTGWWRECSAALVGTDTSAWDCFSPRIHVYWDDFFRGGPRGRGRVGSHLRAWFALVLLTLLCLVVFLFFCHRGGHGVSMRQSVKNYGSPLWWSGLLQFMINVALRLCVSCFLCFNNDALCSCICLAF